MPKARRRRASHLFRNRNHVGSPVVATVHRPEPETPTEAWGRRLRGRLRRRIALRKVLALASAVMAAVAVYVVGSPPPPAGTPAEASAAAQATSPPGNPPSKPTDASVPGGTLGLAADEVAVALQRPAAPLPLEQGHIVELVAVVADDRSGASANRLGRARVVALDDRSITVALPAPAAWSLIEYRAIGTIETALTPHRAPP